MTCRCGSGRRAEECLIHFASPGLFVPSHLTRPARPRRWRHLPLEGIGPLRGISQGIAQHEERFGEVLPDFSGNAELFIASDYSGPRTDKASRYEVLSFLIFPYQQATTWHRERLRVRQSFLRDRTMSFKSLGDKIRKKALPDFLVAANTIPGLLITAAISKAHSSLFQRTRLSMNAPDLVRFSHWDRDVFEKLLRVVHVLSFFLANLSHERQSFRWYSDNDDIAANQARKEELGDIWRDVVANMIPHFIREVTIGTESDDDSTRSLADVLAVPDLACGVWCLLLSRAGASNFIHATEELPAALSTLSNPTLQILSWFAASEQPLKRLLCVIDDPIPPNEVGYMCSIPPALEEFRRTVEKELASRRAA